MSEMKKRKQQPALACYLDDAVFNTIIRCPKCGHTDDDENFDVAGAEYGCLFCNSCGVEFDPDSGEILVKTELVGGALDIRRLATGLF